MQPYPGTRNSAAERIRERSNQPSRAVADGNNDRQLLVGQNAHSVGGDICHHSGLRRVRQVVAERDLHAADASGTDHHQARCGGKAEQMRDGRE